MRHCGRRTGHFGYAWNSRQLFGRREKRDDSRFSQARWYSLGSGATLRTCRDGPRRRSHPVGSGGGFSPQCPLGKAHYRIACRSRDQWLGASAKGCACWTATVSCPSRTRGGALARQYLLEAAARLARLSQAGMFRGLFQPVGTAKVDKGLYPPRVALDKDRCEAAHVPEDRQGYRVSRLRPARALDGWGGHQERS